MRIYTGTFVGNGVTRAVYVGAKPKVIWCLGDTAQAAAWHSPYMWSGRSNHFANLDSLNSGCRTTDDGFVVGSAAAWNASGVTHHWVALVPTDASDFDVADWIGNATSGTSYATPQSRQVAAALIKRDSALSGVAATSAGAAALSSLVSGTWIPALGTGAVTVTAENEVNQLDGPGGLGEGISLLAFYEGSTVSTGRFTGGVATGSVVATSTGQIKAAIVYRLTSGGGSARIVTDTMNGKTKPASAAALQSNELTISGNQLLMGSGSGSNAAGVPYAVILLCDGDKTPQAPAVIKSKGKKAVWLSGTSSSVDCGTADGPLLINGAITTEWAGAIYPTAADNTDCPIFMRHGGSFSGVNSASYGFEAFRSADSTFAWPGPCANIVTSDRFINAPDIRAGWRCGILLPFGRLFHMMAVHYGGGDWRLYLNGELVKQRKIDASVIGLPNIQSTSGHKTSFGARWTGSAFVSSQKSLHRIGRVYNVALTPDEVLARYQRVMLGSAQASEVTRGLAEEWDAANAAGLYMPATLSASNNGVIAGGSVITL